MTKTECLCPHGIETDIYCEKCAKLESVGTWLKERAEYRRKFWGEQEKQTKMEIQLLDTVTKNVWNAAIEEAAKCVELTSKFGEMGRMAEEIRKLCVFGDNSGFAYSQHSSQFKADAAAIEMDKLKK